MAKCWYTMFLYSGLFTYTLVTGNDILHKHFRMFCLISGSWQRPNSSYHLHSGNNWVPDRQTLEVYHENVCWMTYIHCAFGAVRDTEENTFCASGSGLYNLRKFLKNKMHQMVRLFHQKVMPRLFLFALKGRRTSLQMEWG